mmetsp:Transcript_58536/g.174315  ORF Transcript_58536/g.174315 Transcript_58536/m.174315 type:complete len:92 (-) Transcript_58536:189-464(-)
MSRRRARPSVEIILSTAGRLKLIFLLTDGFGNEYTADPCVATYEVTKMFQRIKKRNANALMHGADTSLRKRQYRPFRLLGSLAAMAKPSCK